MDYGNNELKFIKPVPIQIFDDENLKSGDKLLYALIDTLSSKRGFCWATNATLSEYMKVSERQICFALNRLCSRGYISREQKEINGAKHRTITPLIKSEYEKKPERATTPRPSYDGERFKAKAHALPEYKKKKEG